MSQDGKLRGFAMGQAISVRTDYTAGEVRRFAQRAKDAAQARRLLAIAAVLDGASREEAATIGGMDRQTLRDWVIRFNELRRTASVHIQDCPNGTAAAFMMRSTTTPSAITSKSSSLHSRDGRIADARLRIRLT